MKMKMINAVLVAAVLVASFSVVGSVYAQSETPEYGYGYGNGVQQQLQTEDGLGLYHDEIMTVFSTELGLTVEEIEAKIDDGQTIAEIALEAGLTFEEFKELMPVGSFGARSAARIGRGAMVNGENAQLQQGPLALGDGTCLEDGQPVREFAGMGQSRGRGR